MKSLINRDKLPRVLKRKKQEEIIENAVENKKRSSKVGENLSRVKNRLLRKKAKNEVKTEQNNVVADAAVTHKQNPENNIEKVEMVSIADKNDNIDYEYHKPTLKDKLSKITKKQWAIGGVATFLGLGLIGSIFATKSIKLVDENPEIYVGDNVSFDYIVEPENASNKEADITIDEEYFELQEDGTYKALKDGETTLTLSQNDKVYNEYEIIIQGVLLKKLEFSENSIELGIGNSYEPLVTYYPENTTYPNYSFASENEEIASVVDNKIVGINEGTTNIVVTSDNGIKATLKVDVIPVVANSIEIKYPGSLKIGDEKELEVDWNPENVTYKDVAWSLEDTNLATITSDGKLTCLKDGKIKVIATETSNNKTAEKEIRIYPIEISSIEMKAYENSLYVGYSAQMFVTYLPENATYKECTFSSSDESILSVNEYGYVTAVAVGKATITALTSNGRKADVTLEVKEKPVQTYTSANASGNNTSGKTNMVWISASGSKYHSKKNCSGMKNPWQVTEQEAIDAGRQACKKCH